MFCRYTEHELGKRSGIFTASGLVGTMIGGFIQTGIHSSMDGLLGMAGWRWLFIIDGLLCVPVAVYGYFLFPDTPSTAHVFYLSDEELAHAKSRVPVPQRGPLTWTFVKSVLTSWYWIGFVVLWIIAGETESFSSNGLLSLYMKYYEEERGYTVAQLNNYPTGVAAVGIVSTLFWATLTDFMGGKRYLVGYWIAITGVATSVLILLPNASETMIFVAYYWAGSVYACT